MPLDVAEAVDLLGSAASAKRRQGAKRLRVLGDPGAAPAVRTALVAELSDAGTWETQYQLVMALGMTGDAGAVPLLKTVALEPRRAVAVNVALGDARVRLGQGRPKSTSALDWCLGMPAKHPCLMMVNGNAGGDPGRSLMPQQTVGMLCRTKGFVVEDGNPWWYRLAPAPWSGRFYATADAFYDNGATSGPLADGVIVDTKVPLC